jgi:hypothetical protein
MKNLLVAKILNEIADILEVRDVEFKPRAQSNRFSFQLFS